MIRSPNGNSNNEQDRLIDRAIADSAQIPVSVARDGIVTQWSIGDVRGTYLPPFGTRARELALRRLYRMDEMNLIRAAVTGIAKVIATIPWEIKGADEEANTSPVFGQMAAQQGWRLRHNTGVEYYQEVFRQANFGAGWGTLIAQGVENFLRYDTGWFLEAIAAGDSYDKPLGPITGIANLDTLKCYPTGDPRYPAVYYDRWGGLHVLHHSRVIRLVDMEDGDELRPGYGDCGLSRAVSVAFQEVWIQRYITARLDDQSPPGVTVVHGVVKAEWELMQAKYQQRLTADAPPTFGQRLFVYTMDPAYPPKLESYDFQAPPEKFDYRIYTDINVDRIAAAFGIDRQEIMALANGNMGSGSQSVVLAQKSRGKTIGFLLQQLERKLNDLLPDEFTFEFKYRDSQEALEEAQKMQIISAAVASMGAALSADEQRALLADQIESVRDVIKNSVLRANDVINTPFTAEDNTAGSAPTVALTQGGTPGGVPGQAAKPQVANAPQVNINDDVNDDITAKSIQKSYSDTLYAFTNDVRDLLMSASTPNPYLDRRAFTVTMRSFLKNYGLQAYKDGMAQGGVSVDTLDPEDNLDYMTVFVDQSQYINGLADDVYKTKTVNPANAQMRASMWGKSLQSFDDAGMLSADKNGMRIWRYGDTEHCKDCLRLNGQVHRVKTWKARGMLPRSSALACHGFNCKCQLDRTIERARGRF